MNARFAAPALALSCGLALAAPALAQEAQLPETITLNGIVRDFKDKAAAGGHADFQRQPASGFGHYVGQVQDTLSPEGLPVFASQGYKVSRQWQNASGHNIIPPRPYISPREGDYAGARSSSTGGSITTAANFDQWFRDVPGVNVSKTIALVFRLEPGTNRYIFDDTLDPTYRSLGGFFPIDGQLYGNYAATGKNYHFTFAMDADFTYRKNTGQVFTFIGDDDVWVYVDDKLVIDLGGVHAKVSQTIDLDRLTWLQDGQQYKLRFFFAERHTTQSNFRIETTLQLRFVSPPPAAPLCD